MYTRFGEVKFEFSALAALKSEHQGHHFLVPIISRLWPSCVIILAFLHFAKIHSIFNVDKGDSGIFCNGFRRHEIVLILLSRPPEYIHSPSVAMRIAVRSRFSVFPRFTLHFYFQD